MLTLKTSGAAATTFLLIVIYLQMFIQVPAQTSLGFSSPFENCWNFTTGDLTDRPLASDNDSSIYSSTTKGIIRSIDSQNGTINWETVLGGEIISTPLSDGSNVFVLTSNKDKAIVRSLSKNLGVTDWQNEVDSTTNAFLFQFADRLFLINDTGRLYVFNKNDGILLKSEIMEAALSTTPVVCGDHLVFGLENKKIILYSLENIALSNQINTPSTPNVAVVFKNKYLFWSDLKGDSFASDLTTKKTVWKFRSGAGVSNVLYTESGLLISSLDNYIYLVSIEKGKVLWKKRLGERLTFMPVVNDNYVVVLTSFSKTAEFIDIQNGKFINQIMLEDNNYFLNAPIVLSNLLIFPTLKGLSAYSNKQNSCPAKAKEQEM